MPGSTLSTTMAGFDCNPAGGSIWTLVGAFRLPEPLTRVVSMDADIDLIFPDLTDVPGFWSVGLKGCNPSGLAAVRGMPPGCDSLVNAFCSGDSADCDIFYLAVVTPSSNKIRLSLTIASFLPGGVTLPADPHKLFAFALNVPMAAGALCDGCLSQGAVTWSTATLRAVDDHGHPLPPITVSSGGPGSIACAAINGANCALTPTRRTSWGRLKALYR